MIAAAVSFAKDVVINGSSLTSNHINNPNVPVVVAHITEQIQSLILSKTYSMHTPLNVRSKVKDVARLSNTKKPKSTLEIVSQSLVNSVCLVAERQNLKVLKS